MSSYLEPIDYTKWGYRSGWDIDLLGKALLYKQQKYDAGYAKLQNQMNQLGGLDFAKEGARDYFNQRMKMLENEVRKAGMGDLGLNGVSEHISGFMSQAVDDKVTNEYAGTLSIRNIQKQAQKSQEKNDGSFSQLNYDYSLDYASKWLQTDVGTPYKGNSNYIPYTDIVEKANKVIKELEPNAYVSWTKNGDFTVISERGEILSSPQIKAALEATIMQDPNVVQQLQINGWGDYRYMSDKDFVNVVKSVYPSHIKALDNEINSLKKKRANNQSVESSIALLQSKRNNLSELINASDDKILAQKNQIAYQLYKNDFINQMSNAYAYSKIKDRSFETYQEGLVKWKHQRDLEMEEYKMRREELKQQREDIKSLWQAEKDAGGIEGAKQYAKKYLGWSDEQIDEFYHSDIKFNADPKEELNRGKTFHKEDFKNNEDVAYKKLEQSENNIFEYISTDKGKKYFGLGNQFPKNEKEAEELIDCLKDITKERWDDLVKDEVVVGSYDNMKTALTDYKTNKDKSKIAFEVNKEAFEAAERGVLRTLKDGNSHKTKDGKYRITYYPKYQKYGIEENDVEEWVGLFGGYDDINLEMFFKHKNITGSLQEIFPDIDVSDVWKTKHSEIFAKEITPTTTPITTESDVVMFKEIINKIGLSNTNDKFKKKIKESGFLTKNSHEYFKKKTKKDEEIPSLPNMRIINQTDGKSYIEFNGEKQEINSNIISGYIGEQIGISQRAIQEEKMELIHQSILAKNTPPTQNFNESEKENTTIEVKLHDNSVKKYDIEITYQVFPSKDVSEQVKTLLRIKDNGKIINNTYISNQSNLFDAKQYVKSLFDNGSINYIVYNLIENSK